jgi:hypothetical protein
MIGAISLLHSLTGKTQFPWNILLLVHVVLYVIPLEEGLA